MLLNEIKKSECLDEINDILGEECVDAIGIWNEICDPNDRFFYMSDLEDITGKPLRDLIPIMEDGFDIKADFVGERDGTLVSYEYAFDTPYDPYDIAEYCIKYDCDFGVVEIREVLDRLNG